MSDRHTAAQGELEKLQRYEDEQTDYQDFAIAPNPEGQWVKYSDVKALFRASEGQAQTSAAGELVKLIPTNDAVYAEVCRARNGVNLYVSTNAVNDTMAAVRRLAAQLADSTAPVAPDTLTAQATLCNISSDLSSQAAEFKALGQVEHATQLENWSGEIKASCKSLCKALVAPTAQQSLTAGGAVEALSELRADLYELQDNLEAFGEYSQGAAHAALEGAIEALDEVAEKYLSLPCARTAEEVEEKFARTLPGPFYMDLPDGGSPSILEQVTRMAQDAARFRWLNTYHVDSETRWCAHMLAKRLFRGDYDDVARDIDLEMNKDNQQ